MYRLVAAVAAPSGLGASQSFMVAVPDVLGVSHMSHAVDLDGPRELAEDEAVPVWAFVAHTDGRMYGAVGRGGEGGPVGAGGQGPVGAARKPVGASRPPRALAAPVIVTGD